MPLFLFLNHHKGCQLFFSSIKMNNFQLNSTSPFSWQDRGLELINIKWDRSWSPINPLFGLNSIRRVYLVTGLGQAGGINCVASPHWLVDSPRSWGRCCLGGSITDNLMWQYCDTSPLNTNYKHISISVTSFYQFGSETQRWEASLGLVQIYIIDRYKYKPVTTASGLWIWRFQIDQFWYNLNVLFLFCIFLNILIV